MNQHQFLRSLLVFTCLGITLLACNGKQRRVPVASVDFVVDVYGYDNDLAIGRTKIFDKGIGHYGYFGVIVYRYNIDDFVAYDLACPNDYEHGGQISFSDKAFAFVDSVGCQTHFNVLNGAPNGGPYKNMLCSYRVTALGQGRYRVHN